MPRAEAGVNAQLLSAFDTGILVLGLVLASILYLARKLRGRVSAPGQFLMDWLGIWTIVELGLIGISSCNHAILAIVGIVPPNPVDIIKNNGLLLPVSMMYCAGLVFKNTLMTTITAIKEPEKETRKSAGIEQ